MKHLAAAAVVLSFVWPAAAGAHGFSSSALNDGRVGRSKAELVAQRDYSSRVVRAMSLSWVVAPRHATCWSRVPWRRECDRARRRLLAHRWLLGLATARLRRIYPPPPTIARPTLDQGLVADFACIHRYEGDWTANTGNGYYGGLQMDSDFMRTYAPDLLRAKGTADNWTPLEQMQTAERAYQSGRGFYPWPNTARMCGLL